MNYRRVLGLVILAVLIVSATGCGRYIARRVAQAPNTYPDFFAPPPRVTLDLGDFRISEVPAETIGVGPPEAALRYRVIEPADFNLQSSQTHWTRHGRLHSRVSFDAASPMEAEALDGPAKGTIVLLHGYALDHELMVPWALSLAEQGWQCVLVDLRGHGRSTGRRIHFGTVETLDLQQLLTQLMRKGRVAGPVGVLGESYGAVVALRWLATDPRITAAVAIAPYPVLADAALNVRSEYAAWFPRSWLRAGLRQLPRVLKIEPELLDPVNALSDTQLNALFIAGGQDRIAPVDAVERLRLAVQSPHPLLVVPDATHENLPYQLPALDPQVHPFFQEFLQDRANTAATDPDPNGVDSPDSN
jgi:pimeloyl-ACP methyl ester carboxylesterase